jgi:hypothetical protein
MKTLSVNGKINDKDGATGRKGNSRSTPIYKEGSNRH